MKKNLIQAFKKEPMVIFSTLVVFLIVVGNISGSDSSNVQSDSIQQETSVVQQQVVVCDGRDITENCELEGTQYDVYKYHPAVAEKTHIERTTTYVEEIVRYCTLCVDGTYSPSCATGRGACSHHGGVAEWGAPVYRQVAQHDDQEVVDAPAVAEYYEIIVKEN